MKMKPPLEPQLVEQIEQKIYATARLDKGTTPVGSYVSFFTVPMGQHMPTMRGASLNSICICPACGRSSERPADVLTEEMKAGELGTAIGDTLFKYVRLVLSTPLNALAGRFEFRIAGRVMFSESIQKMQAGFGVFNPEDPDAKPTKGIKKAMPLMAARTDTVEGRLYVDSPIEADCYVRVEFDAVCRRDL